MTTVHETSRIQPPTTLAADEMTVPLSFFDMFWLHFHPLRYLIFYDHPCSEAEFLDTIVPNLKHSLSLTLKHYLPVAGNLLYPSNTEKSKPVIRYVSGDAVPLTVTVSGGDFDELTGSHARESDQFYDFLQPMPPLREEADYTLVPLIALQATLFPGRGICVGLTYHHCLGDARSLAGFMWAWADINRHGGGDDDDEYLSRNGGSLPLFDRSVLGDQSRADEKYWNYFKNIPLKPSTLPLPTNRVRAAFTLHQSDIKKLKNQVQSKKSELVHVSSFVVTAAYTWSSMLKSSDAVGEEAGEDTYQVFFFPVDGRGRPNALVDPPVPVGFFGNCLGGGIVKLKHSEGAGEGGFLAAADAISDVIKNEVNDGKKFLEGADDWMSDMGFFDKYSTLGVTGSPKFDLSNADFGWGKGRRLEVLSMDGEKYTMSLSTSSESAGGLVVGMSLPRERMEAFAAVFEDGLIKLSSF